MYFVDNNTGTTEMPALAPSQGTEVKWFTEGDGNKGISHIGQDWLNIIQAELLAILTEGKIQPDKMKLNQLTLAIKAIITANAFLRKNNLKGYRHMHVLDHILTPLRIYEGGALECILNRYKPAWQTFLYIYEKSHEETE